MKPWLASVTVVLLGLGLAACGEAGKRGVSSAKAHSSAAARSVAAAHASGATLPQPQFQIDAELDSDSYPGEPDNDNNHVFGHAASGANARAATALVRRYYAAAAVGDGAVACRLMYSSFAEAVPEDYGQSSGSPSTSAKTCAATMSSLFKHLHRRLSVEAATLKVAKVRVRQRVASVRLGFGGGMPKYYLELRRERGAWKLSRLLASEQAIYVE